MEKKTPNILKHISSVPVERVQLASLLNMDDRALREYIESLRKSGKGAFIFNRQDGLGYYRSMKLAEVQSQFNQNIHRITSLTEWTLHLYNYLKSRGVKVEWKIPRPKGEK